MKSPFARFDSPPLMTRDECITAAAQAWADGCARQALLSPRQAAQEAYQPGGHSVDELEARIRARRAKQSEGDVVSGNPVDR